jgi:tetratricopeptide (TPR) repeat protein
MIPFPRLLVPALLAAQVGLGSAWAQASTNDKTTQLVNERVVFYEALVSEFSAQAGDPATAFPYMLDAAQRAKSERLFERAVELGFAQRNASLALQAAQAWAKALPTSAQAHRYSAQILIGLDRLMDAVEPLRQMLQTSNAEERATLLALLPSYFARVKDRNQAVDMVQKVLAPELGNHKTGPAAWAAMARMQAFAGNDSLALSALEKASTLDPQSDEAALAALQIGGKTAQGAQELLQKRLQNKPGTALRMAAMRSLIDAQQYAQAYAQLLRLTEESPGFADAWLVKGSLEAQNDQLDAAQASVETYLKLSVQHAAEDTPRASEEQTPRGTVEALLLLASISERNKNYQQASDYLDRIYSPPHMARTQMRRASIAAAQGKLDEARALLQDIPSNNPETLRARYNAELQLLRERALYSQALDVAQEAALAMPDEPVWRYEQAMLAEKLGRLADMEALLRGLIASHPQYPPSYNALGYSLADRNQSLDEARTLVAKALEFAPDDAYIIDSMGWVEFRSGNLARARELLEKAFNTQPDAEIAAHLGEVLWKLGDTTRAQAVWKEGLKLNARNATLLETMGRLRVRP